MLGRLEAVTQPGEIRVSHRGFLAQARVQRLLTVLSFIPGADVALLGGNLGAQPPELSFVSTRVVAHAVRGTSSRRMSCAWGIVAHRRHCRAPPRWGRERRRRRTVFGEGRPATAVAPDERSHDGLAMTSVSLEVGVALGFVAFGVFAILQSR